MQISEQAQIELKKALYNFNKPGAGIHLFSTQGCCGPSIQMDVSAHIVTGETLLTQDEIGFFVTSDILSTLAEVTIEYGANGFRLSGMRKSGNCCG
jgi:Fe-S cluster assembly iron-binding protein IscA